MSDWILSTAPGYLRVAPDDGSAFTPVAAFSTRRGGVSAAPFDSLNLSEGVGDDALAVRDNRARLLGALDLDPARVAWATQVHGAHVLTPPGPGLAGTGDALVTRDPDLVLVVGAADCLAVLPGTRTAGSVGAAHAGWRGTVAGVVPRLVEAMVHAGAAPARLGPRSGPASGRAASPSARTWPARFDPAHVTRGRPDATGASPVDRGPGRGRPAPSWWPPACAPARIADSGACTACDAATLLLAPARSGPDRPRLGRHRPAPGRAGRTAPKGKSSTPLRAGQAIAGPCLDHARPGRYDESGPEVIRHEEVAR